MDRPKPKEPAELSAVLNDIIERLERIEAHARIHRETFVSFVPSLGTALKEIREAIDDRP